jgi:hypothetical protein
VRVIHPIGPTLAVALLLCGARAYGYDEREAVARAEAAAERAEAAARRSEAAAARTEDAIGRIERLLEAVAADQARRAGRAPAPR